MDGTATPEALYEAILTRDRRFDGHFFVGVHTTGIYCRPTCPARKPLLRNVTFYTTAWEAQEAGFRPCLRCRPESRPTSAAWKGTSTTVTRALRLLATQTKTLAELPKALGVSDRRLRQLFSEHLGTSPKAYYAAQRLELARKIISESHLPLGEVALASGFQSIRRFNDEIKKRFGLTPRELRARSPVPRAKDAGSLVLQLGYRSPIDFPSIWRFLEARATPGVEIVGERTYSRSVSWASTSGWIEVSFSSKNTLEVRLSLSDYSQLMSALARLRTLFDLDADAAGIHRHLKKDPFLKSTVQALPGLRVPGSWEGFELAIRAVVGQQVSVKGATTLMGRIAQKYGRPVPAGFPAGVTHFFPEPRSLAGADLAPLGFPGTRAKALRLLSEKVARGELTLDASAERGHTMATLLSIPGIGPWTAEYIAMRVLRDPDAFPATDLVLKRALAKLPDGESSAEKWRPWRSYAAIYLWRMATT